MTPAEFIRKWSASELRERQGSQSHFNDLCALIGQPTPSDADPSGATYCFERGATKVGGGDGWADVWRRGCFGWEYKGKHKDLGAALRQLQIYAPDLENPPYLVVCDMERIVVHTNWTNTVRKTFTYGFEDLRKPVKLDELRQIFEGSDSLKPNLSPQELTAKVATRFGDLGRRLQEQRGHEPRAVAHFLNRLIFCLFAEDAGLLPNDLFGRLLRNVSYQQYNIPKKSKAQLDALFAVMAQKDGGFFGADAIRWFNGGLFDNAEALPLERDDVDMLVKTAKEHDWSNIDPAILGTMFEEALKTTGRRAALGAHYTDREKILKIVEPVIVRPLTAEWDAALVEMRRETDAMKAAEAERDAVHLEASSDLENGSDRAKQMSRRKALAAIAKRRDAAYGRATEIRDAFLARLTAFRVLDPACGSGNFLYVALQALRDIELRALLDSDRLGVPQVRPCVGLDAVRGIEIEPYAAELARVTLWIGNLQWEHRNGYPNPPEPVLHKLETIECRDALLNEDGSEAAWPAADVIVGNPPFLGGKRLRDGLGDDKVKLLFAAYKGRVPAEADLVCYWVEKAWRAIGLDPAPPCPPHGEEPRSGAPYHKTTGKARAGLVTTNSIRGGANRRVLDPIASASALREAWSDEPWVLQGAAVRVSMIAFGQGIMECRLNGATTVQINADLTGAVIDVTKAARLKENAGIAFMGDTKGGAFDIPGDLAREWLRLPLNPNGRPNSDVLKPWRNAIDVTRRSADKWIIDFGWQMSENEAALYEAPFQYILTNVKPERQRNNREQYRKFWWRHVEPRQGMWRVLSSKRKWIVTPRVAKHRLFVWQEGIEPDSQLIVIGLEDDTAQGILQSYFHSLWALRLGTSLEDRPRYTPSTTFETFPFPDGLIPSILANKYTNDPRAQNIAVAAAELDRLRENWLNPVDLVHLEPEVVSGYPDRVVANDEEAAKALRKRTLTKLYNEQPTWLVNAHRTLDEAVSAAYGWPADLSDDEVLTRLLALNHERKRAESIDDFRKISAVEGIRISDQLVRELKALDPK